MTQLFDLTGRTALVTGASRGLGLEAARALAGAGACVVLNARTGTTLEGAAAAIRATGGEAEVLPGDLSDAAGHIVARAVEMRGGLDILVHAAAGRDRRGTPDLPTDAFRRLVDGNLVAAYDLVRAALPHIARSTAGRVILVSSIAARLARAGDPAYAAAKGGLSALARSLAVEFGAEGITVNAIAPGFFATDANETLARDACVQAFIEMRVPARRWGRPPEIASAVLFLASPASGYVNGTTLTVDGGLSAQM